MSCRRQVLSFARAGLIVIPTLIIVKFYIAHHHTPPATPHTLDGLGSPIGGKPPTILYLQCYDDITIMVVSHMYDFIQVEFTFLDVHLGSLDSRCGSCSSPSWVYIHSTMVVYFSCWLYVNDSPRDCRILNCCFRWTSVKQKNSE